MSKQKKAAPISIPSLCELYGKDPSQMRKMIDKLKIKKTKVRRADDNRIVTVIADVDHQKLVDHFENMTAKNATKGYISVKDASKKLGYETSQMSNFTRACATYDIELHKKKFNGRTQTCVTIKDFKKFMKLRNTLAVVDV